MDWEVQMLMVLVMWALLYGAIVAIERRKETRWMYVAATFCLIGALFIGYGIYTQHGDVAVYHEKD
jgi:CHASE2 domain-containing sensor protein